MSALILARVTRGTGMLDTDAATAARRLVGHLHYQQYRPRCQEEQPADRRVFSATADQVPQRDILAAVLTPGYLRVVLHTCILAPNIACDERAWTRQWLAEREAACLCWFGVLHRADQDTDGPHVHVGLVKAEATSPRLLPRHQRSDQAGCRSASRQDGVVLQLPSPIKKESC